MHTETEMPEGARLAFPTRETHSAPAGGLQPLAGLEGVHLELPTEPVTESIKEAEPTSIHTSPQTEAAALPDIFGEAPITAFTLPTPAKSDKTEPLAWGLDPAETPLQSNEWIFSDLKNVTPTPQSLAAITDTPATASTEAEMKADDIFFTDLEPPSSTMESQNLPEHNPSTIVGEPAPASSETIGHDLAMELAPPTLQDDLPLPSLILKSNEEAVPTSLMDDLHFEESPLWETDAIQAPNLVEPESNVNDNVTASQWVEDALPFGLGAELTNQESWTEQAFSPESFVTEGMAFQAPSEALSLGEPLGKSDDEPEFIVPSIEAAAFETPDFNENVDEWDAASGAELEEEAFEPESINPLNHSSNAYDLNHYDDPDEPASAFDLETGGQAESESFQDISNLLSQLTQTSAPQSQGISNSQESMPENSTPEQSIWENPMLDFSPDLSAGNWDGETWDASQAESDSNSQTFEFQTLSSPALSSIGEEPRPSSEPMQEETYSQLDPLVEPVLSEAQALEPRDTSPEIRARAAERELALDTLFEEKFLPEKLTAQRLSHSKQEKAQSPEKIQGIEKAQSIEVAQKRAAQRPLPPPQDNFKDSHFGSYDTTLLLNMQPGQELSLSQAMSQFDKDTILKETHFVRQSINKLVEGYFSRQEPDASF